MEAAMAALRQKKAYENEMDRLAGTRLTLETQVRGCVECTLIAGQCPRIGQHERRDYERYEAGC